MTVRKKIGLLLSALLLLLIFGSQPAFAGVTNKTLTLGQEYVSGQILAAKDVDRYKITIPSAGILKLSNLAKMFGRSGIMPSITVLP